MKVQILLLFSDYSYYLRAMVVFMKLENLDLILFENVPFLFNSRRFMYRRIFQSKPFHLYCMWQYEFKYTLCSISKIEYLVSSKFRMYDVMRCNVNAWIILILSLVLIQTISYFHPLIASVKTKSASDNSVLKSMSTFPL